MSKDKTKSTAQRVGLEYLAARCGMESAKVRAIFDSMVALMEEGRTVAIPGFGSFSPGFVQPRIITSPIIPVGSQVVRRRKVVFKMSDKLREQWVLERQGDQPHKQAS